MNTHKSIAGNGIRPRAWEEKENRLSLNKEGNCSKETNERFLGT